MKWQVFRFRLENTDLLKQWQNFYNRQPSPPVAERPEFIIPLLSRESPDSPLYLLVAEKNNETVSILPLSINIRKKYFLKWRELGFVYHNHSWLHSFPNVNFGSLNTEWIKMTNALKQTPEKWCRLVLRNMQVEGTPIDFHDNHTAYFKTEGNISVKEIVSNKLVKNIKRLSKQFVETSGQHNTVIFNQANIDEGYKRYLSVDSLGWKAKQNLGIYNQKNIQNFYAETMHKPSNSFRTFISIYTINDKDIAGAFGYYSGRCIYLHNINFDPMYSQLSPGSQLLMDILEYAGQNEDIDEVNLVTDPEWVQRWHPNKRCIVNMTYYRSSLKGLSIKILHSLFSVVKKNLRKN